jgi:integrase
MALFMLNTGLRDQELCQPRWNWEVQVPEIGNGVFVIPGERSKNGEERVVMLNRIAREVIDRQRGKHPERVFTYESRPVSHMLNTSWKRARIRAGLPQLRVTTCGTPLAIVCALPESITKTAKPSWVTPMGTSRRITARLTWAGCRSLSIG